MGFALTVAQRQVAERKRHQVEQEKFEARQAAMRGEGPLGASFAIATTVTLWPDKVHAEVSDVRASKQIFTPAGRMRLPFETPTRPEAGFTQRLGLCESYPDL